MNIFEKLKRFICLVIIFLVPLFFLGTTQEPVITNKLYLLASSCLMLFFLSTIEFLISKKLSWEKKPYDLGIGLFLAAVTASVLISSPNKIQAVLNSNFGLLEIFSLAVLYFYLSRMRGDHDRLFFVLSLSSLVLSVVTIILFFQPLKNLNLPASLQFLNNPFFSPAGTQLDLAVFLGFSLIFGLMKTLQQKQLSSFYPLLSFFSFVAFSLTLFKIIQPILANQPTAFVLPPFRLSWYAAVEILKNPLTALFGVGVDNFASVFTKVKDFAYVQSSLWQINSFSISRSTLLHIVTETGVVGLAAFGFLLFTLIQKKFSFLLISVIVVLLLLPPSFPLLFLFFFLTAGWASESENRPSVLDLSRALPLTISVGLVSLVLIVAAGYLLGRSYAAEYFFRRSLEGYMQNNIKKLYDNQKQAVLLNRFLEKLRISFSQTNIFVADNVAAKTASPAAQLSQQDRQIAAQAIQAAIAEAKAAVSLNPQKSQNWENLAAIYRSLFSVAQNADTWTISSYQRAIVLDPQNPNYRLNLGGVYYQLGNYDEAIKLFEQTIVLKPNWANAHYNLAWATFQKKDYKRAVGEMQNALSFLNPSQDQSDYQRAKSELEEFKKKLASPPETSP